MMIPRAMRERRGAGGIIFKNGLREQLGNYPPL